MVTGPNEQNWIYNAAGQQLSIEDGSIEETGPSITDPVFIKNVPGVDEVLIGDANGVSRYSTRTWEEAWRYDFPTSDYTIETAYATDRDAAVVTDDDEYVVFHAYDSAAATYHLFWVDIETGGEYAHLDRSNQSYTWFEYFTGPARSDYVWTGSSGGPLREIQPDGTERRTSVWTANGSPTHFDRSPDAWFVVEGGADGYLNRLENDTGMQTHRIQIYSSDTAITYDVDTDAVYGTDTDASGNPSITRWAATDLSVEWHSVDLTTTTGSNNIVTSADIPSGPGDDDLICVGGGTSTYWRINKADGAVVWSADPNDVAGENQMVVEPETVGPAPQREVTVTATDQGGSVLSNAVLIGTLQHIPVLGPATNGTAELAVLDDATYTEWFCVVESDAGTRTVWFDDPNVTDTLKPSDDSVTVHMSDLGQPPGGAGRSRGLALTMNGVSL